MRTRCCLWVALAVSLVGGCSGMQGKPFDASLVGQERYLCCNIRFNPERRASDANYGTYIYQQSYAVKSPMLTAGTHVRITRVGGAGVEFQLVDEPSTYTITFGYGRKQMKADDYFRNILRATNPMGELANLGPRIGAAIREGRLVEGMTKEQALIARGYPPAHRTPSLELNEWLYYETPGVVDRVVFADGKIQSVQRGEAPQ